VIDYKEIAGQARNDRGQARNDKSHSSAFHTVSQACRSNLFAWFTKNDGHCDKAAPIINY